MEAGLALALSVLAGCSGGRSAEPPAGSAVLGSAGQIASLSAGDLDVLRRGGVREVFLDAGAVAWAGTVPRVERLRGIAAIAGTRLPVVLSVSGRWEGGADGASTGQLLGVRLRELARQATAAGVTAAGVHLDLVPPSGEEALEAYGEAVAAVADELPEGVWLAVSLDRAALHAPAAEAVAGAADAVVPFLYGPRSGEGPGPRGEAAWSLDGLERDLARLGELGRPFLVGVGTVGGVARPGAVGELLTGVGLGSLLASAALDARPPPLFAAPDLQLYPFVARRPLSLGDWRLAAGDAIEARRLAPHHLAALAARIGAAGAPLHLGQLYDRLPWPAEGLALSPAELAAAGDPAAAAPRLDLGVDHPRAGALVVRLAHRGGGATEVAGVEHNYVEVRLDGGSFGAVDPGDFARYELRADGRRAADMAALRRADVLRLYAPYVEAGDELASGLVRHSGRATVSGRFLLPDATVVEVAPAEATARR